MSIMEITLKLSDPYQEIHRTMIIDVNTIARIQLGEIQVHTLMLPEVVVVMGEEVVFVDYAKEDRIRREKDMRKISDAISFWYAWRPCSLSLYPTHTPTSYWKDFKEISTLAL